MRTFDRIFFTSGIIHKRDVTSNQTLFAHRIATTYNELLLLHFYGFLNITISKTLQSNRNNNAVKLVNYRSFP